MAQRVVFEEICYVNKNNKRTRNDVYYEQVPFGQYRVWKFCDIPNEEDYDNPLLNIVAINEEELRFFVDFLGNIHHFNYNNVIYPFTFNAMSHKYIFNVKTAHLGVDSRIQ